MAHVKRKTNTVESVKGSPLERIEDKDRQMWLSQRVSFRENRRRGQANVAVKVGSVQSGASAFVLSSLVSQAPPHHHPSHTR